MEKFEFHHELLDEIAINLYSHEYNEFKYNSCKERNNETNDNLSLFTVILKKKKSFINKSYNCNNTEDLDFHNDLSRIEIWNSFYLRYNSSWNYVNSLNLKKYAKKIKKNQNNENYSEEIVKSNDRNYHEHHNIEILNVFDLNKMIEKSQESLKEELKFDKFFTDTDTLDVSLIDESYSFINEI